MIENAWNEYRAWAQRARTMQAASLRWSRLALVMAGLAAVLGCAAGQAGLAGTSGRVLAFLAAAAAAVTPVLGRDILDAKREAGWICARATAEAIKSECFRFAAGIGPYAAVGGAAVFAERRAAFAEPAIREGLTSLPDLNPRADTRCPPAGMDAEWYLANRLREQRDRFYLPGQERHERAARNLRAAALCLSITAALAGAAAGALNAVWLAPWIGVISSVGALLVAYGLLDRRQFLAATYAAMGASLSRIEETSTDLASLVERAETLLEGEHAGWTERMSKSIPPPPAAPTSKP